MVKKTLISPVIYFYRIVFVSSFLTFYICLILFSPLILFFLLYRLSISLTCWIIYRGRYQVTGCSEGIYAIDTFANVLHITFFCYVDGQLNLPNLQQRFHHTFINYRDKKTGIKPYEKLLCAIVPKWGFMCFQNTRNSFDISQHVKICPGINPGRIYNETEMFDEVAKGADDLWPEGRPRWEVLLFPNLKMQDSYGNKVGSALCLKFHHAYVDGVSLSHICRNVLLDQPAPKQLFDPVNPPIPEIPWYMKMYWWIMVFICGPYASMRLMSSNEEHVFNEGALKGNKIFGRSHASISMEMMRSIRETFGCCTSAIQHSAYLAAMRKMAIRKGFQVPDEMIAGATFAHLPYKNEYPTNNHIYFGMDKVAMGITNPIRSLAVVDHFYKKMAGTMYDKMESGLLFTITGVFPVCIVKKTFGRIGCSYFLSNVPGTAGFARLQGNQIPVFFGFPPTINGIRYTCGVGVYGNKFTFGFNFEKSNLIQNRQDVDQFIGYFKSEIDYLYSVTEIGYR